MKINPYPKLEPGKYYHIYNRGNNKETIFKEPQNYYYFLSLWTKYIEPVAKTYCYSLLPNHFHFLIRITDRENESQKSSVSQAFSNLFNAYAKAINKKYHRTGSLFQENFKRKEITGESYFTYIVGYILTNPVKHGFCKDAATYPYSSYKILLTDNPTNLLRDEIIQCFTSKGQLKSYIESYQKDILNL
jgi:putative transposase